MEEFKKLLDKDNKNPHLYNNIGLCYSHLGQTTMAEEYFKKALFIDDKMVETYINLADIYYKENRLWDAIDLLQGAIALVSDNAALRHYLARIYIEDKRYDGGYTELKELINSGKLNDYLN